MIKNEEINNPNSCLSKAKPDELIFVLLARDKAAPFAIRQWVNARIALNKNKHNDYQIVEALRVASEMEK